MPLMHINVLQNLTPQTYISRPGCNFCATVKPMVCPFKRARRFRRMCIPMPTRQLVQWAHLVPNGTPHLNLAHLALQGQPRMAGQIDWLRLTHPHSHRTLMSVVTPCEALHLLKDNQVPDKSRCAPTKTRLVMLLLIVAHLLHVTIMRLQDLIRVKDYLSRRHLLPSIQAHLHHLSV